MASRIEHFQVQDAERVKEFIIRYQDQLLYATDISLNDEDPDFTISDQVEEVLNRVWLKDWEYFTTSKIIENGSFGKYLCLDLPVSVLEKIYFKNAIKMYPGLERK
jgi:chloramphenicol O-acetyltransferase